MRMEENAHETEENKTVFFRSQTDILQDVVPMKTEMMWNKNKSPSLLDLPKDGDMPQSRQTMQGVKSRRVSSRQNLKPSRRSVMAPGELSYARDRRLKETNSQFQSRISLVGLP